MSLLTSRARTHGMSLLRSRNIAASRASRVLAPPITSASSIRSNVPNAPRRSVLLSGLAAICAPNLIASPASIAASVDQGLAEYERLESEGKLSSLKALENIRAKLNFRRGLDGRVYVKSSKGKSYAVRLDMEMAGIMLLRDADSGEVYGLQTEGFQQIDLTSDQVVIALFADGKWETAMSPISFEDDEDGKVKTLTLDEKIFRNLPGLMSGMNEEDQDQE